MFLILTFTFILQIMICNYSKEDSSVEKNLVNYLTSFSVSSTQASRKNRSVAFKASPKADFVVLSSHCKLQLDQVGVYTILFEIQETVSRRMRLP